MVLNVYVSTQDFGNSKGWKAATRACERGDPASTNICPHPVGGELRNVVERGFRFSEVGLDVVSCFVQRPESVAEQVLRIVFSFELYESVPVLAETGFSFLCGLAAAEEARERAALCYGFQCLI